MQSNKEVIEFDIDALTTQSYAPRRCLQRHVRDKMRAWVIAGFLILSGALSSQALEAPFTGPSASAPGSLIAKCPPPPPPLSSLPTQSRYRPDDPTKSKVDPELSRAYEAAVQPMRDFQGQVVSWANSYFAQPSRKIGDAACALSWMHAWATAAALVSLPPGEGQFNRDQAFAGLGLAYLQIANVVVEGPDPRPAIVAWLRVAAEQARVHYETQAGRVSRMNNHRYYAAVAVGVAGIAAQDDALFAWSMDTLHQAVCSAGGDGSLPLEMSRGSRAREYQMFATGPLVMLAELGASNGIATYEDCDGALPRIVDFTLRSIDDPRPIEAHAEQRQLDIGELKGYRLAWLAPWLKRSPDPEWEERVEGIGKLRLTSLGGDLSLLFNN